jgi:hypothetical protein
MPSCSSSPFIYPFIRLSIHPPITNPSINLLIGCIEAQKGVEKGVVQYMINSTSLLFQKMVQYTLAQSPEVLIDVPGRDSNKAREKAMDQLMALMDDDKLPTALDDGFNPKDFIEVKEPNLEPTDEDNAVVEAVQTLSNLAKLKVKVQGSRAEALKVREIVDLLFTDEFIEEEQIEELNNGFKTLKTFAQTNLRYRDAKEEAEGAREVLDAALNPPPSNKKAAATEAPAPAAKKK